MFNIIFVAKKLSNFKEIIMKINIDKNQKYILMYKMIENCTLLMTIKIMIIT